MNYRLQRTLTWSLTLVGLIGLTGCGGYYVTPNELPQIPIMTEGDVTASLSREPAATFPARLVLARIVAPRYSSGSFNVQTARNLETEADLVRITSLEGIESVAVLSGLMLPGKLSSTHEVRAAAADLRGDIVLMYTIESVSRTNKTRLGPIGLAGLGFIPNHNAVVSSTSAATLIDVRTGFVYGIAEATAKESQRSNLWNAQSAIESAQIAAERKALSGLLEQIDGVWRDLYSRYGSGS